MKRISASFLFLALLFLMIPAVNADSAEFEDGDYVCILGEDGAVTITEYKGSEAELTVPGTLGGKAVTEIGPYAFEYNDTLTGVIIPEGVIALGTEAFMGCRNLHTIVLPNGLTDLGYSDTFNNCISFVSINIPDGIMDIGSKTFENCKNLETLVLPDGLTEIGSSAFAGYSGFSHQEEEIQRG